MLSAGGLYLPTPDATFWLTLFLVALEKLTQTARRVLLLAFYPIHTTSCVYGLMFASMILGYKDCMPPSNQTDTYCTQLYIDSIV